MIENKWIFPFLMFSIAIDRKLGNYNVIRFEFFKEICLIIYCVYVFWMMIFVLYLYSQIMNIILNNIFLSSFNASILYFIYTFFPLKVFRFLHDFW